MRLTIFTPTYNRQAQLNELYVSIAVSMQHIIIDDTVEWLIIDDGSEVDITPCIEAFSTIKGLSIKYIRKENGGKHTAFNVAIAAADSDIFVCIDDDDRLTKNSIDDIFKLAKKYRNQHYGGVVGRVIDENGKILGPTIFDDVLVSNTIEIRDKYHFWGEPEIFFTRILKKYQFDVFQGEKFLTEAYVFDKMSLDYPFIYTNKLLMIKKYLPNGLTDNQLKIRIESPLGTEAYYFQRKQLCRGFLCKLKASINRRRFSKYSTLSPRRPFDIYECIAMPIAWFMAIKDKHDYVLSENRRE